MEEAKKLSVSNLSLPSRAILQNAKRNLTQDELLVMPRDSTMQKIICNARKPIGENSVDKNVREIEWLLVVRELVVRHGPV